MNDNLRHLPSLPRIAFVGLILTVLTIGAFWQLKDNGFINYDDISYVTENPQVQGGLSRAGLLWAFTTTAAGNWHPLTWLSHMLDWQLFGANPQGHHLSSLFFHIVNTLLLFLVMVRLTRRLWPSALVAALFALHPLHVESVAWASERKDVLSGFFWLITMWAYLHYLERPGTWRYLLILLSFALGLMAKPMLVTEPLVLLLLDYWPLGRWPTRPVAIAGRRRGQAAPEPELRLTAFRLVWEKAPMFALAAVSCPITIMAQKGSEAVISMDLLPLGNRVANALVAYIDYLAKMLWPQTLAIFYPHPLSGLPYSFGLAWWQIVGAGLILMGITTMALRGRRRFPYLPVGWFWYLGTLVPVIGLVQVGAQAMADRYTYIPLIGIFIILAFGAVDLAAGIKRRQVALSASFGLALLACLFLTWRQVGYWRDSETLLVHAAAVTENNMMAYYALGQVYDGMGRRDEAIAMFYRAIRCNPKMVEAYNYLAIDLAEQGDLTTAIDLFQQAIRLQPEYDQAYHNLGLAYLKQSRVKEARKMFEAALKKNPENTGAREMLDSIRDQ